MSGYEKEWGHRKPGYRKEIRFFLDRDTSEYATEKILTYKKKLESHIKKEDPDAILKYLRKLEDSVKTVDMILPTGIGKMVTKLKALADEGTTVYETCKRLVKKWKGIVKKFEEDNLKRNGLKDFSKEEEETRDELDEIIPGSKEADEYFRTTALSAKRGQDTEEVEINDESDSLEYDPILSVNIDDLIPGSKEFDEYIEKTAKLNRIKKTREEVDFEKMLDDEENEEAPEVEVKEEKDADVKLEDDAENISSSDDEDITEYPQAQLIPVMAEDKTANENEAPKEKDPSSPQKEGDEASAANSKTDGPMLDKNGNWVDHLELTNYISKTFESFALDIVSKVKKKCKRMNEKYDDVTYYSIYGRKKRQDFPCPKCDKVWDESLELIEHLIVHFPGPDFVPDTYDACLRQIKLNAEADHKKYCRKMCKRRYLMGLEEMKTSKYSRSREDIPYVCPKCDTTKGDFADLKRHMLKHWNFNRIKCEECGERFKGAGVLGSHEKYQEHVIQCLRRKNAIEQKRFEIDKNKKNEPNFTPKSDKEKLKCQGCDKKFHSKKNLITHILAFKATKQRPFKCALCCLKFDQGSFLIRHNEQHHPSGPIQTSMCPHCQCLCGGIAEVHKHVLEIHGELADLYVDDEEDETELKQPEENDDEGKEKRKQEKEAKKKERAEKEKAEKELKEEEATPKNEIVEIDLEAQENKDDDEISIIEIPKEKKQNKSDDFNDAFMESFSAGYKSHMDKLKSKNKKKSKSKTPKTRNPPTVSESLSFMNREDKMNEIVSTIDSDEDLEGYMSSVRSRRTRSSDVEPINNDKSHSKNTNKKRSRVKSVNDENNNEIIQEYDENDPLHRITKHRKEMEEVVKLWKK